MAVKVCIHLNMRERRKHGAVKLPLQTLRKSQIHYGSIVSSHTFYLQQTKSTILTCDLDT
jgi:uridine phosphorylase